MKGYVLDCIAKQTALLHLPNNDVTRPTLTHQLTDNDATIKALYAHAKEALIYQFDQSKLDAVQARTPLQKIAYK